MQNCANIVAVLGGGGVGNVEDLRTQQYFRIRSSTGCGSISPAVLRVDAGLKVCSYNNCNW